MHSVAIRRNFYIIVWLVLSVGMYMNSMNVIECSVSYKVWMNDMPMCKMYKIIGWKQIYTSKNMLSTNKLDVAWTKEEEMYLYKMAI